MPVIVTREEVVGKHLESNLARVPYICYPINFRKKSMLALLDSGSEFTADHLAFAKELGLLIRQTDMGAQKINGIMLEIYEIVVVVFLVEDKAN